jgi:ribosomal protein L11 methyltransferase
MNLRIDFEVLLWIESPDDAGCTAEDLLAFLMDYPVQAIHESAGPGIGWLVSFGEHAWETDVEADVFAIGNGTVSPLDGTWRSFPELSELVTANIGKKILATFPNAQLHCELRADLDSWSNLAFERSYDRVQVGRITVSPPWQFPDPAASTVILTIRPSMGFGTGHHPSTRLALAVLQQVDASGREVLDVGTGSGILAMAASRLGASRVCAIDRDADAVTAARENLRRNPLARVDLTQADISTDYIGEFDLVLANHDATQLQAWADILWSHVRPTGQLLVSGFLTAESDAVQRAFAQPAHVIQHEDGWTAAVFASGLRHD